MRSQHSDLFWTALNILLVMVYLIVGFIFFCLLLVVTTELLARWNRVRLIGGGTSVGPVLIRNLDLNKCDNCDSMSSIEMSSHISETEYEQLSPHEKECVICLSVMKTPNIERLRCSHFFHKDCLSTWMRTRNNCPTCRSNGCCVRILNELNDEES